MAKENKSMTKITNFKRKRRIWAIDKETNKPLFFTGKYAEPLKKMREVVEYGGRKFEVFVSDGQAINKKKAYERHLASGLPFLE